MSSAVATQEPAQEVLQNTMDNAEFVTVTIAGQLLGLPVLDVEDVLGPQKLTRIPLAPPAVAGALNLRGRIVTAIDVRRRLGLTPMDSYDDCMSIVVEHMGEPYSLLIDTVGEVLSIPMSCYERNPATLDAHWAQVSAGIFRLDGELLVALEVDKLLDFEGIGLV